MEDSISSSEIAMLRRFEPVIRLTRGERFFPMDVTAYIQQCSLWVQQPDRPPELLVPQGEMTVEKLIQPRQHGFGAVHYLKFIEPLDILELAKYSFNQAVMTLTHRSAEEVFRAGRGRLARVGYMSRLLDALFSLTLFMRGRVPGDTATAAALTYKRLMLVEERYCYYGRVVRQNGWVALQYWFFYPFNNWRSGFFGVNDHEGDWEMAVVYCSEEDSDLSPECRLVPQWVAYASHDFSGDDLRRRWDDPEVEKITDPAGGEHPVIYAGAGSHASYFSPGEYLAELELPFLLPLVKLVNRIQDFWVSLLRQAGAEAKKPSFNIFRVPFVDYARGDGLSIGPFQNKSWEPQLLNEDADWAMEYRGLWGLYARDPISGENAPAGPVYNRDGSVRQSWYDLLGWAGLDKLPPPDEVLAVVARQRSDSQAKLKNLEASIEQKSSELVGLGVAISAVEGRPHLRQVHIGLSQQVGALSQELTRLRKELTVEQAKLEAYEWHAQRVMAGDRGPLRSHIRHAHQPSSEVDLRLGGLAEIFSAISIGLFLVALVLLILLERQYLVFGLAAMIGLMVFIEASFRRQVRQLVSSLVIGLAVVSALILFFEFFWQIVVAAVLAGGVYIMWENLREIRS